MTTWCCTSTAGPSGATAAEREPEVGSDSAGRVGDGLDLAAVMERADGYFLDEVRNGECRAARVGAAGRGGADRAAPPAREPRDQPLARHGQDMDRVPTDRGEARR